MRPSAVEFSRPLPVDRVPGGGSTENIEADGKEREALARRFDIPAIHRLSAELRAEPWRGGGLKIAGSLAADLDQICVVTLDHFRQIVTAPVECVYLPEGAVAPDDDDDVDLLAGGVADLGELVAETLALSLDPYPRKPGANFAGAEFGADTPSSSFAPLAILSKTVKREPSKGGP